MSAKPILTGSIGRARGYSEPIGGTLALMLGALAVGAALPTDSLLRPIDTPQIVCSTTLELAPATGADDEKAFTVTHQRVCTET